MDLDLLRKKDREYSRIYNRRLFHFIVKLLHLCANISADYNTLFPGADPREGHRGGGGTCPPNPSAVIFTNIILHCRVLFYIFRDITIMFLSRDSFIKAILFHHLMRWPACQNCTALGLSHRDSRTGCQWTISLALEPALYFNPLVGTLVPHCKHEVGTLAIDRWAVTIGTASRGLGGAAARPGPSSLYEM